MLAQPCGGPGERAGPPNMSSEVLAVVVDCRDSRAVAEFWAAALERTIVERNPREYRVGDPVTDGTVLYFMEVPEPKIGKNRLHVDVIAHTTLEVEIEELEDLGATLVGIRTDAEALTNPDRWAVMTDPEGNEFCVTSTDTLSGWYVQD